MQIAEELSRPQAQTPYEKPKKLKVEPKDQASEILQLQGSVARLTACLQHTLSFMLYWIEQEKLAEFTNLASDVVRQKAYQECAYQVSECFKEHFGGKGVWKKRGGDVPLLVNGQSVLMDGKPAMRPANDVPSYCAVKTENIDKEKNHA